MSWRRLISYFLMAPMLILMFVFVALYFDWTWFLLLVCFIIGMIMFITSGLTYEEKEEKEEEGEFENYGKSEESGEEKWPTL